MNRLLLSLWLVGAAYTGHTSTLLQPKQNAPASAEQLVEARAAPLIAGPASLEPMNVPKPQNSEAKSIPFDHRWTMRCRLPLGDSQMGKPPAPLPRIEETYAPSVLNGEVIWVIVSRAARVHAGPSVSAPTVRFYRVATELHLIGDEQEV
jgi:hypothetical protein